MNKDMTPRPNEGGEQQTNEANILAAEANGFDESAAREAIEQRKAEMTNNASESEVNTNEAAREGIYDRGYREQMNAPISDLFTKRKVIIEEQFPALKPLSPEELQRYLHDKDFEKEVDQARSKVPIEVREEHGLLGTMVHRLDDGIYANLTPDHPWANSSQNDVHTLIEEDGYDAMVVTEWKAGHSRQVLARLRELHEQNSKIVDFSHEQEVDIDTIPEELQGELKSLADEVEALKTANLNDFRPSGNNRPKTAKIYDRIFQLSGVGNLSYAARKEISRKEHEFQKKYMEAEDAARLRSIDAEIAELQKEKAEVEERQKKYANAGFVSKLFGRLFDPKREKREQDRASYIEGRMEELRNKAGTMRGEEQK